jgi:hypothetical protein
MVFQKSLEYKKPRSHLKLKDNPDDSRSGNIHDGMFFEFPDQRKKYDKKQRFSGS